MTTLTAAALPISLRAALRAAFGDVPFESLELLSGGLSGAAVVAFEVRGVRYIVRQGRADRAATSVGCMRIAGEVGVGPRVVYADAGTATAVMERIDGQPFGRNPALAAGRLERVASALRRLHDGPTFPAAAAVREIVAFFATRSVARNGRALPPALVAALERAVAVSAPSAPSAPCHRDLNPNNILETPDRVVFVDWDTAGQGDPFVDLAQLGVFAFPRPDERDALLAAYLGRSPTADERARVLVARVVALALYSLAFRDVLVSGGGDPDDGAPGPSLPELFAALAATRERTDPGLVAAGLRREALAVARGDAFDEAAARLGAR